MCCKLRLVAFSQHLRRMSQYSQSTITTAVVFQLSNDHNGSPGENIWIGSCRFLVQSDDFRRPETDRIRPSESDTIHLFPMISDNRIRSFPTVGFRPIPIIGSCRKRWDAIGINSDKKDKKLAIISNIENLR